MKTELIDLKNLQGQELIEAMKPAAEAVKAGQTVAFPTETVYGLGADARNVKALDRIFEAKGRPRDNPLIVHLAAADELNKAARNVPELAYILFVEFAPGPLTLILQRSEALPAELSAGLDTIAVRIPSSKIAREFIKLCETPIAAPSANISGRPSGTEARYVFDDFRGKIPYVLDGGPCELGLESTVLDLSTQEIRVLRPGAVSEDMIAEVLAKSPEALENRRFLRRSSADDKIAAADAAVKSPGMKYRHYAPDADVRLISEKAKAEEIKKILNDLNLPAHDIAWFIAEKNNFEDDAEIAGYLRASGMLKKYKSPEEAANMLFTLLRDFDAAGASAVLCQETGYAGIGAAFENRIKKAAAVDGKDPQA